MEPNQLPKQSIAVMYYQEYIRDKSVQLRIRTVNHILRIVLYVIND